MRKIAAFILCSLLLLFLGFQFVHPTFIQLANWLGPVIGPSLLSALATIFLLLGDPLRFIVLIALWGGVALLAGVIVRRRIGAVLTMLLVFLPLIIVLGTSLYDVGMAVSGLGELTGGSKPFDVLPPLPTGLTLVDLYEAPIIGVLIERLLGTMQTEGIQDPQGLLMGLAGTLVINLGEKVVILILAALAGVELGRLLEPSFKPLSESIRTSLRGKPRTSGELPTLKQAVKPLGLALMVLSFSLFAFPWIMGAVAEEFYSENIVGYADTSGRAYVGNLFLESGTSYEGVNQGGGLLAGVIISQEGIKGVLSDLLVIEEGFESLINLIPTTMMAAVYVDVSPEEAATRSEAVASAFTQVYGVDLHQMISFEPPLPIGDEIEVPQLTVVLYQSSADLRDLSASYLNGFIDRGGLVDLIGEAITNQRLIPGATPDSADGSVVLSGFVDLAALVEHIPEDIPANVTDYLPVDLTGLLGFSGGASYWDHGVESISEGQGIDILGLLGVGEEPSFSDKADMSLVLLVAPNGTDIGGEEAPKVKITTSLSEDEPLMELVYDFLIESGLLSMVSPGGSIDLSSFEIAVTGVILPLNVEVSKEASPLTSAPNSEIEVTVTVRNLDTEPMID
ncbi:MAG: hypothetical protein JSV18_06915, partial [Candidatus Bathyarchaeota archaeon]